MEKITLSELADALAKRKALSKKDAETFVRVVFDTIRENLFSDELVKVKGLGTFKLVQVDSRESVHVGTGERIVIDSHSKVTFTPDKSLADCVNRPFAAFETVILNDETSTEDMERIDPVMEPEPEPEAEPVAEPVAETIAETIVAPEPKPTPFVEPEPEPIAEPEPVVVVTPEPEPEPIVEPEPEPEPIVEDIPEPVIEDEPESVVEDVPESVVEQEPEPVVEDVPEPVVDPEPEPEPVIEDVSEPEPVVEPEPVRVMEPEPSVPQKNGGSAKWLLWLLLLLLLVGVGYWLKTNNMLNFPAKKLNPELVAQQPEQTTAQQPVPAPAKDTTDVAQPDTPAKPDSVATPATPSATAAPAAPSAIATKADAEKLAADYPQIENGEYWITGLSTVHVLAKGEDLSVLAKKYYGDKRLISYIIRMNHYTNARANNLFVGAEVKIPELVKR